MKTITKKQFSQRRLIRHEVQCIAYDWDLKFTVRRHTGRVILR